MDTTGFEIYNFFENNFFKDILDCDKVLKSLKVVVFFLSDTVVLFQIPVLLSNEQLENIKIIITKIQFSFCNFTYSTIIVSTNFFKLHSFLLNYLTNQSLFSSPFLIKNRAF